MSFSTQLTINSDASAFTYTHSDTHQPDRMVGKSGVGKSIKSILFFLALHPTPNTLHCCAAVGGKRAFESDRSLSLCRICIVSLVSVVQARQTIALQSPLRHRSTPRHRRRGDACWASSRTKQSKRARVNVKVKQKESEKTSHLPTVLARCESEYTSWRVAAAAKPRAKRHFHAYFSNLDRKSLVCEKDGARWRSVSILHESAVDAVWLWCVGGRKGLKVRLLRLRVPD